MALTPSFSRPVSTTYLTKNLSITAAIAEITGGWAVDIYLTVTTDASATVNKVICRKIIPYTINGTNIKFDTISYKFAGNATTYSSGGTTPALSSGTLGDTIDIDAFLTQASDTRENPS